MAILCKIAHPSGLQLRGKTQLAPQIGVCMKALRLALPRASIQLPEFELGGFFKFHCVSLCGGLYPLPRRTTFRFRNAFHLMEARNSVSYVRGIFQRLLALLREREPGCGYPITSCLGQLCYYFSPSGNPRAWAAPDSFSSSTTAAFPVPAAWLGSRLFPMWIRPCAADPFPSCSFLTRAKLG